MWPTTTKEKIYIGFFTFAGYDQLIIAPTEEECWERMKKTYFKWRKSYNGSRTWEDAKDYFGYRVIDADANGDVIEY